MPNLFLMICTLFLSNLISNNLPDETSDENATIVFYRGGRFFASAVNYALFANGEKICKLSNSKFIEYEVPAGDLHILAKRGGVEAFKKETEIKLDVNAGQTYYVRCSVKAGFWKTRLEMEEVQHALADVELKNLTLDRCQKKLPKDYIDCSTK